MILFLILITARGLREGLRLGLGENSPKNSRIEPMNRRKTSNTQHSTSNNQWFPIGPLIGGWVLDVGCSMFPRVHGKGAGTPCPMLHAPGCLMTVSLSSEPSNSETRCRRGVDG